MNTPTTAAGNAERARFEAWAGGEGYPLHRAEPDSEDYFDTVTYHAWKAWLAATQPREAPQGLREAVLRGARDIMRLDMGVHPKAELERIISDRILAALAPYVTAQPAPTPAREEVWCAACGKLGDHGSGTCPTIRHPAREEGAVTVEECRAHIKYLNEQLTTARQQLAEALESKNQQVQLCVQYLDALASLRTLASELAGALEKIKRMSGEDYDERDPLGAVGEVANAALARFRSSTPAPATAQK